MNRKCLQIHRRHQQKQGQKSELEILSLHAELTFFKPKTTGALRICLRQNQHTGQYEAEADQLGNQGNEHLVPQKQGIYIYRMLIVGQPEGEISVGKKFN